MKDAGPVRRMAFFALALVVQGAPAGANELWIGEIKMKPSGLSYPLVLELTDDKDTSGKISVKDFTGLKLKRMERHGQECVFEVAQGAVTLAFQGTRNGERMEGTVSGILHGSFLLLHVPSGDQAGEPRRWLGSYRGDSTRATLFLLGSHPFALIHAGAGEPRLFRIFPGEPGSADYFAGGEIRRIRFEKNGTDRSVMAFEGKRLAGCPGLVEIQEARLEGARGAVTGSLFLPAGKKGCPAVVMVNGSGPHSRHSLVLSAWQFALHGVACLVCDKAGCGDSEGEFRDDVPSYAEDARSAVAFLSRHASVERKKIGLWGVSQGGWVIPKAAAGNPDVAFAILVSPCAESTERQDLTRVRYTIIAAGFPEKEAEEAVRLIEDLKNDVEKGASLEACRATLTDLGKRPWWPVAYLGLSPERMFEVFMGGNGLPSYDPASDLERLGCPALVFWGDRDPVCPPAVNRPLLEAAFAKSGNKRLQAEIIEGGGHGAQWEADRLAEWIRKAVDR